jgi:hypothetical protein
MHSLPEIHLNNIVEDISNVITTEYVHLVNDAMHIQDNLSYGALNEMIIKEINQYMKSELCSIKKIK